MSRDVIATALQGTLRRTKSGWRWSDGTPSEGVRDARPEAHYGSLRIRAPRSGSPRVVEVPSRLLPEHPELAVWSGYPMGLTGDRHRTATEATTPGLATHPDMVHLVPHGEWDDWARSLCLGAEWDAADEAAIMERARSLGYGPGQPRKMQDPAYRSVSMEAEDWAWVEEWADSRSEAMRRVVRFARIVSEGMPEAEQAEVRRYVADYEALARAGAPAAILGNQVALIRGLARGTRRPSGLGDEEREAEVTRLSEEVERAMGIEGGEDDEDQ